MMLSVTVIILQVAISQAHAKDPSNDSMDKLADKFVNMLVDRIFSLSVHQAALDKTTLASLGAPLRTAAQPRPLISRSPFLSSPFLNTATSPFQRTPAGVQASHPTWKIHDSRRAPITRATIDYKDPAVLAEFEQVQPLPIDIVEKELMEQGIPVPETMNEMDIRLMLVETRMRTAGTLKGAKTESKPKKEPGPNATPFEKAMYEFPKFEGAYNWLKDNGEYTKMNIMVEWMNDPDLARSRYEKTYPGFFDYVDSLLIPDPTTKVTFSGFPSNMGEDVVKMTLEGIGPLKELTTQENDDGLTLSGSAEFEDVETATQAIAKYNGMDMGGGNKLVFRPLAG